MSTEFTVTKGKVRDVGHDITRDIMWVFDVAFTKTHARYIKKQYAPIIPVWLENWTELMESTSKPITCNIKRLYKIKCIKKKMHH